MGVLISLEIPVVFLLLRLSSLSTKYVVVYEDCSHQSILPFCGVAGLFAVKSRCLLALEKRSMRGGRATLRAPGAPLSTHRVTYLKLESYLGKQEWGRIYAARLNESRAISLVSCLRKTANSLKPQLFSIPVRY